MWFFLVSIHLIWLYSRMLKKNFALLSYIYLLLLAFIANNQVFGQTRYFDLTLNGNYSTNYTSSYKYTRTSWGIDLGIPLGNYFEINIGECITRDLYEYNDEYKNFLISKGNSFPPGDLSQEYNIEDTYANLSFGLFNKYVSPSIYGGLLNRQIYYRDYYGQTTHDSEPLTWDAGAALSIYMGRHLRLKVTYRISPSGVSSPSGDKYYDEAYWLGLTISI